MTATLLKLRCPLELTKSFLATAPSGGVTAGDMAKVQDSVGIYVETAAVTVTVGFIYKAEKVVCPAASAATFSVGDKVYFDSTNAEITNTASGNTLCGVATVAKTAGQTEAEIELDGNLGITS